MPWYLAAAFAGYTLLLAWQTTMAIRIGRRALAAVPFLLAKLCVLAVALSYWEPLACAAVKHLGLLAVTAAGVLTFREAAGTLRRLLTTPRHPVEADNWVLLLAILATVVFPAVVFFFAARVVLSDACAV